MNSLVLVALLAAAVTGAPTPDAKHETYVYGVGAGVAHGIQVAAQDIHLAAHQIAIPQVQYEIPAPVSAIQEVKFAAPEVQYIAAAAPELKYDFPAPIAAPLADIKIAAPEVQYVHAAPQVQYVAAAAPQVEVVAAPALPEIKYNFPATIAAPAPLPEIKLAAPEVQFVHAAPQVQYVAAAAPQVEVVAAPALPEIKYDFPAAIAAPAPLPEIKLAAPEVQVVHAAPQVQYVAAAAPQVQVVQAAPAAITYSVPVETRVHYASKPVVVGHSTQILKPSLAAPVAPAVVSVKAVAEEKAEEAQSIALAAPAYVAGAHFGLNLAAAVPAGDAPHFDELFTQEKVLAPVRTSSQITQQVTVRHPTKVNVEKVAVDVAVPTPYAHPVPVAVPGPHYAYSAPHFVHA